MDVLVTGASSGFGRLTVESLARRGHRVVAGLRDVGGRNEKAAAELTAFAGNPRVVEIDVTDQDSVDRAVAGLDRLDAVVNNAGGIFAGPVEAFTAEEAARQLDVNVLGALRVGRAVLPGLRRQGSGVLIQIGSLSGRVALPFSGLYAASKAALGSVTEAWHHELAPFGVESVVVEAASYPTNIGLNATVPADAERMAPYTEAVGGFTQAVIKRSTELAADPQVVADAVVALVETPAGRRPLRTVVAHPGQLEAVEAFNRLGAETTRAVADAMGVGAYLTGGRSS
ncbi:SDR family NAD(P)-dependent oxidoreductase [Actinoplanes sp. NPDC049265]|uniref:SDR family NAD(P)-dependent oxidoreductase n=1 Tax=Actinoplanes sp. NPDC049265 TaxID=3363902 RepID=UPI003719173A